MMKNSNELRCFITQSGAITVPLLISDRGVLRSADSFSIDEPEVAERISTMDNPCVHRSSAGTMGDALVLTFVDREREGGAIGACRLVMCIKNVEKFLILRQHALSIITPCFNNCFRLFLGVANHDWLRHYSTPHWWRRFRMYARVHHQSHEADCQSDCKVFRTHLRIPSMKSMRVLNSQNFLMPHLQSKPNTHR